MIIQGSQQQEWDSKVHKKHELTKNNTMTTGRKRDGLCEVCGCCCAKNEVNTLGGIGMGEQSSTKKNKKKKKNLPPF